MTNAQRARSPPGTATRPTWAQSTWACSPTSGSVRRNASCFGAERDVLAQRANASGVAALLHHVEEARRPQPRIADELLVDEPTKRIDKLWPWRRRCAYFRRDDPAHDVGMDAELRGDGANRPMLGVVKTADLCVHGVGNGHRIPRSRSCRTSWKSPTPSMRAPRRFRFRSTTSTS